MSYETGAVLNKKVKINDYKINYTEDDIDIKIETKTDKCSCYLSKVVKDVVIKESPNFIKLDLLHQE